MLSGAVRRRRACTPLYTEKLLPAGMVLWEWDADAEFGEAAGQQWLHLLPQKWNKQVVYGWRYDPREFAPAAPPARDPRRRGAVRAEE